MQASKGSEYCGEHFDWGNKDNSGERRRIRCPLDPTHTVFEARLKQHLKKCNASKKAVHSCYSPGINAGQPNQQLSSEESTPLSDVPSEILDDFVSTVMSIKNDHLISIPTSVLSHPILDGELHNPQNGSFALKHLSQQSSILGHMAANELMEGESAFIEFGAGRGKLSHWIQKAMGENPTINYVLVDRSNCRRKMDLYHRFASQGPKFHRLLMDIQDLDLRKLEVLESSHSIVGVTKHLCGAGTDLALRCVVEQLVRGSSNIVEEKCPSSPDRKKAKSTGSTSPKLKGVIFALCCHHRCSWESYVGADFFTKDLGLSPQQFNLVRKMSSWAVCGQRAHKHTNDPNEPHPPSSDSLLHQNEPQTPSNELHPLQNEPNPPLKETHPHQKEPLPPSNDSHPLQNMPKPPLKEAHIKISHEQYSKTDDSCPPQKEPHLLLEPCSLSSKLHPWHGEPSPSHKSSSTECDVMDESETGVEVSGRDPVQPPGVSFNDHTPLVSHSNYIPHPREHIGLLCKQLIDSGRVWYLRKHGMKANLVHYVDRSVSLENVLLVATLNH
jgi:tRNA:m4X modification enzyme